MEAAIEELQQANQALREKVDEILILLKSRSQVAGAGGRLTDRWKIHQSPRLESRL